MESLSITNSWSLPKPMSIESVIPSNHLILCRPLLLLPSIFPSIRVFSNELALHIRWPFTSFFEFLENRDHTLLLSNPQYSLHIYQYLNNFLINLNIVYLIFCIKINTLGKKIDSILKQSNKYFLIIFKKYQYSILTHIYGI